MSSTLYNYWLHVSVFFGQCAFVLILIVVISGVLKLFFPSFVNKIPVLNPFCTFVFRKHRIFAYTILTLILLHGCSMFIHLYNIHHIHFGLFGMLALLLFLISAVFGIFTRRYRKQPNIRNRFKTFHLLCNTLALVFLFLHVF